MFSSLSKSRELLSLYVGPHRVIGNASIRSCDLVGIGEALLEELEEVCHWEFALRLQKLKPGPVVHFLFLLAA